MKKLYIILSAMFMALTATAQHEYVDLGLPSGTLWATCNVGADSPEESGDYFAWGETAPKSLYGPDNYSQDGYDGSEGSTKELLPEDDAATVNWGSEWKTPNLKQYKELENERYTTTEWTTVNGVSGCKITSKINGNSIFLPAAGFFLGGKLYNTDRGNYWLRKTQNSGQAYHILSSANGIGYALCSRFNGLNIRPVRVPEEKEHEYVDLGLPSGTLWATCNVGAFTPEGYGDYFHWGETEEKETYEEYSFTDNPRELLPENDAAAANWGDDWRTPSLAQMEELINGDYTTTEWTTLNGVNGRKITSKSNGNSIFLPAAGDIYTSGYYGWYWLRSIDTSDNNKAYSLLLNSDGINAVTNARKRYFPVRPVCFAKEVYTEFEDSTGTLTYYYDGQRPYRTGITEAYKPIGGSLTDTRFNDYNEKVTKAVIDPSMKEAPLTSMRQMFYGNGYIDYVMSVGWTIISYPLSNLTNIEGLENLNTENVTNMGAMFSNCEKLDTLDLSPFNTENVTDMSYMFSGCNQLQIVDVSSFDISKVTTMNYMFSSCHELTTIYCTKDWSTSEADSNNMFAGCEKLVGGKGTPWSSSVTDNAYARPDRGEDAPGYFTAKTIKGDVNGDGDVNSGDVVAVYSYIIKGAESGFTKGAADVNGDSGVNSGDVVAIYNIIIGN